MDWTRACVTKAYAQSHPVTSTFKLARWFLHATGHFVMILLLPNSLELAGKAMGHTAGEPLWLMHRALMHHVSLCRRR